MCPGSIVWSDEWRAYSQVAMLPNVASHSTVNNSVTFIDPTTTGTHTQNADSYWNHVKTKLKRMRGCHEHQLPSYLDEFMWWERHRNTARVAFDNICIDIALKYPV